MMKRRRLFSVVALVSVLCVALVSARVARTSTSGLTVVTYQYPAFSGVPRDIGLVQTAINKIVASQGYQVRLQPIDYGSWGQQMKLQFAANQTCDLVYTANWTNSFTSLVAQDSLLPLEKLLPKYAPGLWKSIPGQAWQAASVNGHIYAAINQQIWVQPWGAIFRASAFKRFGINPKTTTRFKDLTPIFARMKAAGISPIIYTESGGEGAPFIDTAVGFDPVVNGSIVGGGGIADIGRADKKLRVFNPVTTSQFKALVKLAYSWRQAGYYPTDEAPIADADAQTKTGKFQVFLHINKPGGNQEYTSTYGDQWRGLTLSTPFLGTTGITSTMTGVCRTSKHPVQAVKFLNALNSNKDVYRLITHGIQGKHWVWVNKKKNLIGFPQGVTGSTSGYNPTTDWLFGNQFNAPYTDASQVGTYVETAKLNRDAPASTALGFNIDTSSLTTELAQLATVQKQCELPLLLGHVNPDTGIQQCINQMNAAGEGKVLSVAQSQLDAWAKTNKKK